MIHKPKDIYRDELYTGQGYPIRKLIVFRFDKMTITVSRKRDRVKER